MMTLIGWYLLLNCAGFLLVDRGITCVARRHGLESAFDPVSLPPTWFRMVMSSAWPCWTVGAFGLARYWLAVFSKGDSEGPQHPASRSKGDAPQGRP